MFLYIKAASPNKFSEYGIMRYVFTGNRNKVVKKLQKAFGFHIFRLCFFDSEKERLCIEFQTGELIYKSRIEHHICLLLERKDIGFLSPSD